MCPRCGERSLERFVTHAYCANCNYDDIRDLAARVGDWVVKTLKTVKPRSIVSALELSHFEPRLA
jgi:ribosomal protein L37E